MRATERAQFEAFVAARSDALWRTAYLLCGDWHQAQDVVQTALIKLYVAWHRVEQREGMEAYARQIVVRCVIDERRRGWRREQPTEAVPDAIGHDDPNNEDRDLLLAALSGVPRDQRAVLVLRYWEDLSIAETAHLLGISAGTVKSRAFRGLTTLRDRLPAALSQLTDDPTEESTDA
jgi:RNA polymerase sigma-70 factor (sigma-E family)